MLNVVMLNVVMLNVVMLSVTLLNITNNLFILGVILCVIMLNVMAPQKMPLATFYQSYENFFRR
jgi:hypothetical protein